MNIQKQSLRLVLQSIVKYQQQLQLIRQLINEELTFDLKTTFYHITQGTQQMNLFAIKRFVSYNQQRLHQNQFNEAAMQNVIKYYSNGKLYLSIDNWKCIMLSREDNLLSKLASQRNYAQKDPPNYILSYCIKILLKECHLHSQIISNLLQKPFDLPYLMKKNQEKLDQFIKSLLSSESCFQLQILKQYLTKGQNRIVEINDFSYLFTPNNSKEIKQFLRKKERQQKQNNVNNSNIFVHRQFRKLNKKNDFNKTILIRQAKSIQNHIDRNANISSTIVLQKIESYKSHLEIQLKVFFKSLDKIMKWNNSIIKNKQQLIECNQTNFSLLFNQISINKQIIPSQLQLYFNKKHIHIPLSSIFILFKKYCDPVTNKINKKQFNRIFQLCSNPQINKTNKITEEFIRKTCLCLLYQIQIQTKINEQKRLLMNKVDLRQIFDAIDEDSDRQLSQTDLKVMYMKIMNKQIRQQFVSQFWWRMNSCSPYMIDYDRFMYQMIPRTKELLHKK